MRAPLVPFDRWPLQRETSFGYVWFTSPAVAVTHFAVVHATRAHIVELQDTIDEIRERFAGELEAAGGLVAIHDLRQLRGYDSEARRAWAERIRARPTTYLRGAAVIVPSSPLVRMAAQGMNLLLALHVGGKPLDFDSDPEDALRRYGAQKPMPGTF